MVKKVISNELSGSYCNFMKEAGLLSWDLRDEPLIIDHGRANLLANLADIEEDSKFMQKKLRHAGALREISISDFNRQWLCEELEHSSALRALAMKRGWNGEQISHKLLDRDKRSLWGILGLRIGRVHPEGITASYLTLGAIQEYVALSAYVILADISSTQNESNILRNITRQEGRHMRFYRTGAESFLSNGSEMTRRFTRAVIDRYWRPPGVDLLGVSRWLEVFSPVLRYPGAADRFKDMDRILANLPGMEGLSPMTRFIQCHQNRIFVDFCEMKHD